MGSDRRDSIPPVRLLSQMGTLLDDIKAKGLFCCHVVGCPNEPHAEVKRVGKGVPKHMRSLFCLDHAETYAAKGGWIVPKESPMPDPVPAAVVAKAWKPCPYADCPSCGSDAEVFTDLDGGQCWDGDIVRCAECGHPGSVTVDTSCGADDDSLDGVARVEWHDDPEWDCCDWCRAHRPAEPAAKEGE